jgi:RNA polymerase sigma factor (sigma-70 family)
MADCVMIVDDAPLVRDRMAALCSAQGWDVRCADSGEAALALAAAHPPGFFALAVVDVLMPHAQVEGIEAARALTHRHRIPCLMLTTVQEAATRAAAALAGAVGYLVKDDVRGDADMIATIAAALRGEPLPDPLEGLDAAQAIAAHQRRMALREAFARLTPQQRRVAQLMQQGMTNQEIARTLVVSVATVNSHVQEVLARLGLSSRRQLLPHLLYDSAAEVRGAGRR